MSFIKGELGKVAHAAISEFRRLRQKDCYGFEASVCYTVTSCLKKQNEESSVKRHREKRTTPAEELHLWHILPTAFRRNQSYGPLDFIYRPVREYILFKPPGFWYLVENEICLSNRAPDLRACSAPGEEAGPECQDSFQPIREHCSFVSELLRCLQFCLHWESVSA